VRAFDWITDKIAQGSWPAVSSRGKDEVFKLADVIVLCAEEHQARRLQAPHGKRIVRLGFDDDIYRPIPPEAGQIFHAHAKELGRAAIGGHKILITCAMGLNRSGLITALTLMHGYRMRPSDAIKLIRGRRSSECLCNPMFEQWLLAHEKR
jgi:protein-tyrosine phosphatase